MKVRVSKICHFIQNLIIGRPGVKDGHKSRRPPLQHLQRFIAPVSRRPFGPALVRLPLVRTILHGETFQCPAESLGSQRWSKCDAAFACGETSTTWEISSKGRPTCKTAAAGAAGPHSKSEMLTDVSGRGRCHPPLFKSPHVVSPKLDLIPRKGRPGPRWLFSDPAQRDQITN